MIPIISTLPMARKRTGSRVGGKSSRTEFFRRDHSRCTRRWDALYYSSIRGFFHKNASRPALRSGIEQGLRVQEIIEMAAESARAGIWVRSLPGKELAMATSREVIVRSKVGLHARPAALFIKTAGGFSARVTVENVTRGTKPVNGKSILNLLSAGVKMDDHIRITADGTDEDAAVAALADTSQQQFRGDGMR